MRPEALSWSAENCSLGRAMGILGDKWTVLILRELFMGIRRFDDLRVRTEIPRQILTNRLARLVEHGVLRREPYREPGARAREEYRLTQKGLDLYPAIIALREWGDRYLSDPGGPPLLNEHRDCGELIHVELRCDGGHEVAPRAVQPRLGPGIRPLVSARTG
jgi:DNA-binding HxlR family transcriptional regulator